MLAGALLVVAAGVATAWRGCGSCPMSARYDLHAKQDAAHDGPAAPAPARRDSASIWNCSAPGLTPRMPASAGVLVADHEPEVGEMSRRYLARAGASVRVVATPAATLSALAAREADLFVIDLTMPGLEAAAVRRVLQSPRAAQSAGGGQPEAAGGVGPVVYLLDRHGVRPRSLSDGLDYRRQFLARPFSPRALVDAVTELLCPGGQGCWRARSRCPGGCLTGCRLPPGCRGPPGHAGGPRG